MTDVIAGILQRKPEEVCHQERNHQGKDNLLLLPAPTLPLNRKQGKVRCRERLGGLLKYYERERNTMESL